MIFSAGTKMLENLKLGTYKFHINEGYLIYVPPCHLWFSIDLGCQMKGRRGVHPKKLSQIANLTKFDFIITFIKLL